MPSRLTVQVGTGATATTTFNAANRPTGGTNPTASYTSDDDGRLTARPNQTMTWDDLGRLTAVKDAAGTVTLAAYTYDPLDRLRMIDYGAGVRTRFRYVGLTTSAAQLIDDAAGTVSRSIGNGWTGERVLDWTGSGSDIRVYGTNAHHDVTWLAGSTGSVSQALRYDPWGNPRSSVPSGYTPFRFQGSFYDTTTDLSWVVTRWYAPALGTFISEDSLLGDPADPPSRHLYIYGQGEPVGTWDPDGRYRLDAPNFVLRSSRISFDQDTDNFIVRTGFNLVCIVAGTVTAPTIVVPIAIGAECWAFGLVMDGVQDKIKIKRITRYRVWSATSPDRAVRMEIRSGRQITEDRDGVASLTYAVWADKATWHHEFRFPTVGTSYQRLVKYWNWRDCWEHPQWGDGDRRGCITESRMWRRYTKPWSSSGYSTGQTRAYPW